MLGLITSWVFGNKDVKNAVFNKLGLTAIFTAVVGFITWITDLVIGAIDQVTLWIDQFVAANWPSLDMGAFSETASVANVIFPLSEMISIYSSLYLLWAIVLLIRWVKSFVPTMAN